MILIINKGGKIILHENIDRQSPEFLNKINYFFKPYIENRVIDIKLVFEKQTRLGNLANLDEHTDLMKKMIIKLKEVTNVKDN